MSPVCKKSSVNVPQLTAIVPFGPPTGLQTLYGLLTGTVPSSERITWPGAESKVRGDDETR